jgi:HSP20 family protein
MTNQTQQLQTSNGQQVQVMERKDKPESVFTPATNIIETGDSYLLAVDMPGVNEKGVDLTLENDVLSIRGHVEPENHPNFRLTYREYETGDYRRVFTLSAEVDRDRIQATVKDGVLHLVLPKAESAKPRKIHVHAA